MLSGKLIALCVVIGLALIGLVVAVLIRPQRPAPDSPGQRLLAHARDRSDYRIFVGVPPTDPTTWAEVSRVNESSVTLRDSRAVELTEVTAYLVVYPGGTLVDHRGPATLPVPAWVGGLQPAEVA